MKRTFIALAIAAITSNLQAQKSNFYIKGGINAASINPDKERYNNIKETASILSFHIGGMLDLPLGKAIFLQPSLLFTGKGAKIKGGNEYWSWPYEATTRPYYIELPLNVVFKFPATGRQAQYFIGGGGYTALGVGGKNKASGSVTGMHFDISDKINYNQKKATGQSFAEWAGIGYMNRLDYGLNATAGLSFKNFIVAAVYEQGFSDINGLAIKTDKNKHRVFSLSVGFGLH